MMIQGDISGVRRSANHSRHSCQVFFFCTISQYADVTLYVLWLFFQGLPAPFLSSTQSAANGYVLICKSFNTAGAQLVITA